MHVSDELLEFVTICHRWICLGHATEYASHLIEFAGRIVTGEAGRDLKPSWASFVGKKDLCRNVIDGGGFFIAPAIAAEWISFENPGAQLFPPVRFAHCDDLCSVAHLEKNPSAPASRTNSLRAI